MSANVKARRVFAVIAVAAIVAAAAGLSALYFLTRDYSGLNETGSVPVQIATTSEDLRNITVQVTDRSVRSAGIDDLERVKLRGKLLEEPFYAAPIKKIWVRRSVLAKAIRSIVTASSAGDEAWIKENSFPPANNKEEKPIRRFTGEKWFVDALLFSGSDAFARLRSDQSGKPTYVLHLSRREGQWREVTDPADPAAAAIIAWCLSTNQLRFGAQS